MPATAQIKVNELKKMLRERGSTLKEKMKDFVEGKKSQESQSAVTKLFKKLGRNTDSSTSSERLSLLKKKKKITKNGAAECRLPPTADATQQKDSYHFIPPKEDETFSRTSCALIRLFTSDLTKGLFLLGFVCTIVLILICLNWLSGIIDPVVRDNVLDDRIKRQSNDEPVELERNPWDVPKTKLMDGLSELLGSNSRDSKVNNDEQNVPDLSTILDPVSVNEAYSSNSLRDFYRKLIKTDVQIKNLRKSLANFKYHRSNDFMDSNIMRAKRSPKISIELRRIPAEIRSLKKRSFRNLIKNYPRGSAIRRDIDLFNDTKGDFNIDNVPVSNRDPMSSEMILPEYTADKKKTDPYNKYSYSQMDPNMKHQQGIKNADPMDDFIRRMLAKQVSGTNREILHTVIDNKENEMLKQEDRINNHPRAESLHSNEKNQAELLMQLNNATLEAIGDKVQGPFRETPLYMYKGSIKKKVNNDDKVSQHTETNMPELNDNDVEYRVTLATTVSIRPKQRKEPGDLKGHFPKLRHLLQHDDDEDDDDDTDYEELTKEPWERDKRTVMPTKLAEANETMTEPTADVSKIINSNWKGPIPLFHNELDYMIKAAMKIATNKLPATESNEKYYNDNKKKKSYIGYIDENSKNDDYDELIEIAQAYSDYGVLKNKKDNTVEDSKTPENVVNLITSEKVREPLEKFKNKIRNKSSNKKSTVRIIDQSLTDQKELQSHKENNMYIYHKRSLKSIETHELDDDVLAATDSKIERYINNVKIKGNNELESEENSFNLKSKGVKIKSNKSCAVNNKDESINFEEHMHNLHNVTVDYNKTSVTKRFGEVLSNIVELCMFLFSFGTREERGAYNTLQMTDDTLSYKLKNDEKVLLQAIHAVNDSEMVGHRSRVLLSFEETEGNATSMTEQQKEGINEPNIIINKEQVNTSQIGNNKIENATDIAEINSFDEAGNKALVKRSANVHHIFWNDLYDDEYGVKDPLENEMKDKSFVKYNDLLAKSENWIGTKFKQIANNVKKRKNLWRQSSKKNQTNKNKTRNVTKRSVIRPDDPGKQTFDALTANMKRVLHEAAQAIRETNSREVRSDKEQAATLMQQLVSLMSALVDIQVRQRTCMQLPDDLRNFLVWLTASNSQGSNDMNFNIDSTYDNIGISTKNLLNVDSFDMMPPNARSECLGTIHDVQDLIQQYDEMSERDKSKMSRVREYLEHQLDFLQKQLSNFNEYGFPFMYQENTIRKRRQLAKSMKHNKTKQNSRKTRTFIKYFDKKRTTNEDVNDNYNNMKHNNDKPESKIKNNNYNNKEEPGGSETKFGHVNEKRAIKEVSNKKRVKKNVKGVYYNPHTMERIEQNNDTVK